MGSHVTDGCAYIALSAMCTIPGTVATPTSTHSQRFSDCLSDFKMSKSTKAASVPTIRAAKRRDSTAAMRKSFSHRACKFRRLYIIHTREWQGKFSSGGAGRFFLPATRFARGHSLL